MPLKPNLSISKAAVDKLKVRWRGVSFQMCVFFLYCKVKKTKQKNNLFITHRKGTRMSKEL